MRTVMLAAAACAAAWAQLRAGAAKTAVTPDLVAHAPVYVAGFGQNRVATGIHDDLFARCLAMAIARRPLVVCSVDSIGLFLDDVDRMRAAVTDADLVVTATHDHEAPDTMGLWGPARGLSGINEAYNSFVVDRVAEAAREAIRNMRPAVARLARAHTPELDAFIHDNRPPVVHDSELVILSLEDREGRPIATAVNWANHPEALGSSNTLITADYPAYLYERLEELTGGMAALWNGAVGGMQSPLGAKLEGAPDNSFEKAERIGRRVAEIAAEALRGARPAAIHRIQYWERRLSVPLANRGFQEAQRVDVFRGRKKPNADGSMTTSVGLIRLTGGRRPVLEIALVPGELYPELSVGGIQRYPGADFPDEPLEPAIKPLLRAPYRMLIGLANDEIGYIIPKAEWDETPPHLQNAPKPWYGEVNSVGPEAAPRILEALRELASRER